MGGHEQRLQEATVQEALRGVAEEQADLAYKEWAMHSLEARSAIPVNSAAWGGHLILSHGWAKPVLATYLWLYVPWIFLFLFFTAWSPWAEGEP